MPNNWALNLSITLAKTRAAGLNPKIFDDRLIFRLEKRWLEKTARQVASSENRSPQEMAEKDFFYNCRFYESRKVDNWKWIF